MLVIVALVLWTHPVHAQTQFGALAGAYIELRPEYPLAGESVTATFKTSSVDMSVSQITWKINGTVVSQGNGVRSYSFTAGTAGDSSLFEVVATPPSGRAVRATKVLRVSDISFAWEGKTYTPPFFPGRALVGPGAEVTIVAFPEVFDAQGRRYDPDGLIYTWKVNGVVVADASGKGKNSAVLKNTDAFSVFGVTLEIKDPTGENRVLKYVRIPTVEPRIVFYEDSALLGVLYNRALGPTESLAGEELRLVAEPYYTSALSRTDSKLTYGWDIGGQKLDTKGSIVLRPEGAGSGSAQVDLVVLNTDFIAQRMRERVQINFGQRDNQRDTSPSTQPL